MTPGVGIQRETQAGSIGRIYSPADRRILNPIGIKERSSSLNETGAEAREPSSAKICGAVYGCPAAPGE